MVGIQNELGAVRSLLHLLSESIIEKKKTEEYATMQAAYTVQSIIAKDRLAQARIRQSLLAKNFMQAAVPTQ